MQDEEYFYEEGEEFNNDDDYQELSGNSQEDSEYFHKKPSELTRSFSSKTPFSSRLDPSKDWELTYSVISMEEVKEIQNAEIETVSNFLGLPSEIVKLLLRSFQWNKEKLIEEYTENNIPILHKHGLNETLINNHLNYSFKNSFKSGSCEICFDDNVSVLSTPFCCHPYCENCLKMYISSKVSENEVKLIKCPNEKCLAAFTDDFVAAVLSDETETLNKYHKFIDSSFADRYPSFKYCPTPNCGFLIKLTAPLPSSSLKRIIPSVCCTNCKKTFCFACGVTPSHAPLICYLYKIWIQKCKDDSETANWLSANTKDCPSCKSAIEKNGGCNHMTCKSCSFNFCWICRTDWNTHSDNYKCNKFEESKIARKDSSNSAREMLERYLFYYNRYANHEQAIKLETTLLNAINDKMEKLQETSEMSWIDVQFYSTAVEVLSVVRKTLKMTYALGYYLKKSLFSELFEDNQRDLEVAVENLAALIETPIELGSIQQLRQAILDKTVYVKSRHVVLSEFILRGFFDEAWSFSVTIE